MPDSLLTVDGTVDSARMLVHRDQLASQTVASLLAVFPAFHRLHTIMDSDRILVLHEGRVREYDAPAALLAQPGSGEARRRSVLLHV